jgi:hypothetical protein
MKPVSSLEPKKKKPHVGLTAAGNIMMMRKKMFEILKINPFFLASDTNSRDRDEALTAAIKLMTYGLWLMTKESEENGEKKTQ